MKLSKANVPFTMVANEVLSRADLSLKAKGLYAYLFSKPDDWDFAAERIAKECKEERKAVMRTLKELEVAKLLTRVRLKNSRMEYHLSYASEPVEGKTSSLFLVVTADDVKTIRKSAKSTGFNYADKAIENGLVGTVIEPLNDLIEEFKPVNPSYARMFANKSQRAALQRVVQSIGFDKTRNAIKAAVACHGKRYAPTIATAIQLEERISSLSAFLRKQGGPAVMAI